MAGKNPKKVYAFDPDYVVPTANVLRLYMRENGLTSTRLVCAMSVPRDQLDRAAAQLDALLRDEPLTDMAARILGKAIGSEQFWRNFEHNYRVGKAAGKHVVELEK